MTTHDVLAFAVASDTVTQMRNADPSWNGVFSVDVHVTSSRDWPQPDFVIADDANGIALAGEFKPPGQTKREYLTGLGQATAYTRDFPYAALVLPEYADDGYAIADHVLDVLSQRVYDAAPVALISYDPALLSPARPDSTVLRTLRLRTDMPTKRASLEASFYAKWRDASPGEMATYLDALYDEERRTSYSGSVSIRDRAWKRTWDKMAAGKTNNWSGAPRNIKNTRKNMVGWGKNWRNFFMHVGWMWPHGALTEDGLVALHTVHRYGPESEVFKNHLATAVLTSGKHLVLINAINDFQNSQGPFNDEAAWLDDVERYLEEEGLLKRNVGRHQAATKNVQRGFLKAEKTLWRNLGLIVPRGKRVFHPGRGFIFDYKRITGLLA